MSIFLCSVFALDASEVFSKSQNAFEKFDTYTYENNQIMEFKGSKVTLRMIFYSKKTPDGISLSRIESSALSDKIKVPVSVRIENKEGLWVIENGVATKKNSELLSRKNFAKATSEVDRGLIKENYNNTYEMEEVSYGEKPCYKVTESFSPEYLAVGDQISKNMGDAPAPDTLKPAKRVLIIEKNTFYVLSEEVYSVAGSKIFTQKKENIKVNIPIDGDLFSIPNNVKKITETNGGTKK